jgi:RHS repeat-associated protein
VTIGGATTTVYVGSLEEAATRSTTTTTTHYYAGGMRLALAVNGTFSYLGSDGLGSAEVALDGSGNVQAAILYGMYGGTRYCCGTMPGSYGFTGQRADAATGLDYYYNARYYDSIAHHFTNADAMDDGLNRCGYVHGNPITLSGARCCADGPQGMEPWGNGDDPQRGRVGGHPASVVAAARDPSRGRLAPLLGADAPFGH